MYIINSYLNKLEKNLKFLFFKYYASEIYTWNGAKKQFQSSPLQYTLYFIVSSYHTGE
jgi:hypothetical protein